MYKSKEDLYKAKVEYYENVTRKMTLIMLALGPCKTDENKVVFVDANERPTLEDLLLQIPDPDLVTSSDTGYAFRDPSGSIVEFNFEVDEGFMDFLLYGAT